MSQQNEPRPGEETFFAPAARESPEQLRASIEKASRNAVIDAVLHLFGGVIAVLNPCRQIIAVNPALLARIGVEDPESVLGLRPGEAFRCSHVAEAPGGCGTGRACRDCGAAIAIVLSARQDEPIERECLLTAQRDGELVPMEFVVRASPLHVEEAPFTLLVMRDIGDSKRRENLERVFFHDILNSLAALQSCTDLLPGAAPDERAVVTAELAQVVHRLVAEIRAHRDLSAAERGEYLVRPREVSTGAVLAELERLAHLDVAQGKRLEIQAGPEQELITDADLLLRVLTNMVKNALEATAAGESVRVRCEGDADSVTFRVWNPGSIDERTARRVFQRSFTTKPGAGRGLGTYSMKLFGEKYLAGEVGFESSEERGTTFHIRLPRTVSSGG